MTKKKKGKSRKGKVARQEGLEQPRERREDDDNEILAKAMLPNMERTWKKYSQMSEEEKANEVTDDFRKDYLISFMRDFENMMKLGVIETSMTDEEKQAKEVHDEALFKGHPQQEDCDICFLPLPLSSSEQMYKLCCGKVICLSCIEMMRETTAERGDVCPFCRVITTDSNLLKLVMKRVKLKDPQAYMCLADMYQKGSHRQQKNENKALEMVVKASELGSVEAFFALGNAYMERDVRKGKYYLELAAMKGMIEARYDLGCRENTKDTLSRGIKHFIIGAKAGHEPSLKAVTKAFKSGYATKDEYAETLRVFQKSQDEMKSKQRDKTRAFCIPIDDEALFKDPPARENCPICTLRLPFGQGCTYQACCGTIVCGGCIADKENGLVCISCRTPRPHSLAEVIKRLQKRMECGDAAAFNALGCFYKGKLGGPTGIAQDYTKAMSLWMKAGELGHADALGNIAVAYERGLGVKQNAFRANHYTKLAAMKGDVAARHNLGCMEIDINRKVKHFMISASAGVENSMTLLRTEFKKGNITKCDFEKTLLAYQKSSKEMKSKPREKAAALLSKGFGPSLPLD
ncbi:hypothetical protein ACHAWF_013542 [Thalassiosira exigua]